MYRLSMTLAAAAAMMIVSANAMAAGKIPMRVCAGSPSGNYTFAANEIAKRAVDSFEVTVQTTGGSLDNLRKLSANECDVAFVQSDVNDLYSLENPAALNTLTSFKSVYSEYVHVLCNAKTGWSRITEIGKTKNGRLYVGAPGSGSAETWRALSRADNDLYKNVIKEVEAGKEAASLVKDTPESCMIWVSGLNSADMKVANQMSINTRDRKPALNLINVDDRDMRKLLGSTGRPMYRFETIERKDPNPKANTAGVYNNMMAKSSVEVPVVDALLMMRKDYREANKTNMGRLVTAVEDALPSILATVNPQ